MQVPPEAEDYKIKKPNRQRKIQPKTHKVRHESGRSLKNLWDRIVRRSKEGQGS